jgi:methyl-accepting chemotaxis protein
MAQAAATQAAGLTEINQAVGHMEQTTQQNAEMVEETTAAAEQLATQAATLMSALGRFRLSQSPREMLKVIKN